MKDIDFLKLEGEARKKYYESKYAATIDMIMECEISLAFFNDKLGHEALKEIYGEDQVLKQIKSFEYALKEKRSLKGFLEKYYR